MVMKKSAALFAFLSLLMPVAVPVFAEDAAVPEAVEEVPPPTLTVSGVCAEPSRMMSDDLIARIDAKRQQWRERYESVKTEDDIAAYQKERREFFYDRLGEMWGRTPLNARVTGVIDRPEYRAEKIVLETLPRFYATGTLFLPRPEKFAPPYPGVLVVCGHSFEGKASDLYQGLCVLGAMNGLAMYIQDPVDQGERIQHFDAGGNPKASTTESHSLAGIGSILLGRNTATYEVWDMIRGLDFLQSRPDVIPDRLGVAGNSGGGTQSSYLMALDDRVLCAAPSCYLCSLYGAQTHKSTPQDAEQNIFGQLGFGMDHADYIIMRAPKPTLLNTKTGDFFNIDDTWASFRDALRIYSRQEHSEALSIVEIEGEHGYCPELLDATVSWMLRWLAGRDERIVGTYPLPTLSPEEIKSVSGGVMALLEARTTYDINRDYNAELKERRRAKLAGLPPEGFAGLVRATAKIRPLGEIPPAEPVEVSDRPDALVLKAEGSVGLPVRSFARGGGKLRLIVSEEGNGSERVSELADRAREEGAAAVWSVEPRGWGESRAEGKPYYNKDIFGPDGTIWYLAYLLGETYVGLRAEDVVSTARFLGGENAVPIELTADTPSAALVALHAAAAQPELFSGVVLDPSAVPGSWAGYVDAAPGPYPLQNVIHAVLRAYDVEDLMRVTGCTVRE